MITEMDGSYWRKLSNIFWMVGESLPDFRKEAREKLGVSIQGLIALEGAFLLERSLREQRRVNRTQKIMLALSCEEQLKLMEEVRRIL